MKKLTRTTLGLIIVLSVVGIAAAAYAIFGTGLLGPGGPSGASPTVSTTPEAIPSGNLPSGTPSPGSGSPAVTPDPSATPAPTGSSGQSVIDKVKVKALYLTGWTAGSTAKLTHYIDLANKTEINAYVIDIKDDDGLVGYESGIKAVKDLGTWMKKYDVDSVIKKLHDNGIYVIGRVVTFKDPAYSLKNRDSAIKTASGAVWLERNSDGDMVPWINPYSTKAWDYLIDIAKEAASKGFDEIQFDYVRFPGGNSKGGPYYGENMQPKHEVIDAFLAKARAAMPSTPLSADVYGIICESPGDRENIGQYLELVGKDMDYISPMVYPSHYARGQIVNGIVFPKPDLEPYQVVYNSLFKAAARISKVTDGYRASLRPYLQDFTATWIGAGNYMEYGPVQVRQQIKAAYDAGCEGWILWDSKNTYSEAAFLPE